ncbi:MAG TPA: methyltransferase domain-containing protein [Spirillospora sp.]|nr:methyltransferase domain-containing protein [Spirillospora sp.]
MASGDGERENGRIAAMFDQLAPTYDATGVEFFGPIADGLVEVLAPGPRDRLLDVGCGRGAVLSRIAPLVEEAVGIDVSQRMVELARESLDGASNVRVEMGDAQRPDPELGAFDSVTASLVLFFLPDPVAALRAWRALLAAGGRCAISIFGRPGAGWQAVDEAFLPYLPSGMRDARAEGPLSPRSTDEQAEALLTAAGFTGVRTISRRLHTRFATVEQWEAFSWSTGQRAMWAAMPEADRPALRAAVAGLLRSSPHPDGGYVLSQDVRYLIGHT